MRSKRKRLDRFISFHTGVNRRDVRAILARGEVRVDDCVATDINLVIDEFSYVTLNNTVLQANTPSYVMMNKPEGVVSATKDAHHKTVIDLLEREGRDDLHIVGRLDFNSSGLLLLTNDGRWSRHLTTPEKKITKLYRVTLKHPVTEDYVQAFAEGMFFPFEGITTRPAKLEIVSDHVTLVSLVEGRYHQIKRMFGRFQNPVVKLQRLAVGNILLDETLMPGESRDLTEKEVSHASKVFLFDNTATAV